jgi:hypothetical protein
VGQRNPGHEERDSASVAACGLGMGVCRQIIALGEEKFPSKNAAEPKEARTTFVISGCLAPLQPLAFGPGLAQLACRRDTWHQHISSRVHGIVQPRTLPHGTRSEYGPLSI